MKFPNLNNYHNLFLSHLMRVEILILKNMPQGSVFPAPIIIWGACFQLQPSFGICGDLAPRSPTLPVNAQNIVQLPSIRWQNIKPLQRPEQEDYLSPGV